ncbi:hypothetical protein [Castellaniella ginsengisoli]|uniref:Uncharacterized protein n=1 Tax=Castellaniella ginsengisoli TaxID=546114 RepID=A0AB39D700_9BURK
MKLNTWTHPSTGAQRVYISGLAAQYGAKVWVEQQPIDTFGSDFIIKARSESHARGEAGNLLNEAEQAINELAGKRVELFSDVLALAK